MLLTITSGRLSASSIAHQLFGKANRRADTSDTLSASVFEEFRKNDTGRFIVVEAIERLLRETKAKYIILSYSSGGRATAEELNDVIRGSGKLIEVVEVDYRRNVMGGMRWTHEWVRKAEEPNREFLFLIQKYCVICGLPLLGNFVSDSLDSPRYPD